MHNLRTAICKHFMEIAARILKWQCQDFNIKLSKRLVVGAVKQTFFYLGKLVFSQNRNPVFLVHVQYDGRDSKMSVVPPALHSFVSICRSLILTGLPFGGAIKNLNRDKNE